MLSDRIRALGLWHWDWSDLLCFDGANESVASPRNRLYKSGILGGVAEGLANFVHSGIQAVIVIDEGIRRPKPLAQFFPAHQFAGTIEQFEQNLQRLPLQARARLPFLAQFSCAAIELIQGEAEDAIMVWVCCQNCGPRGNL